MRYTAIAIAGLALVLPSCATQQGGQGGLDILPAGCKGVSTAKDLARCAQQIAVGICQIEANIDDLTREIQFGSIKDAFTLAQALCMAVQTIPPLERRKLGGAVTVNVGGVAVRVKPAGAKATRYR